MPKADKEPGFDELMTQLDNVVKELEQGNLSLEESLKQYEKGIKLSKQSHEILEKAEKRVETLLANGETEPFNELEE